MPESVGDDVTFQDIILDLITGLKINGTALSDIIDRNIFKNLAAIAWTPEIVENGKLVKSAGKVITSTIYEGRKSGAYHRATEGTTEYVVDRESVLIKVLNDIVFTKGIRDLLGGLLKFDFSDANMTTLTKDSPNYLLTVLLYGVFEDAEALERLLIDLLSWYKVEYEDVRTKDYSDINSSAAIDYEAAGLDKAQVEQLPADIDALVAKIVPAVIAMLPEGTLGGINLHGADMKEMVENLRSGTSVGMALTAFCKDIIHGAGF